MLKILQARENGTATCKKIKLDHSLTPHTNINSKWIKDLKVRVDTIKLLEENTGRTVSDINHINIFFSLSPRIVEIKTKINEIYLNTKVLHSKGNAKQNEKTIHRSGENICK